MTVSIAAIGLGQLCTAGLPIYDAMEDVAIVAGADVSRPVRERFERDYGAPAYDDYRALLAERGDDLDAVTIATPHTLHYEQAMACLDEGLHVYLEKPLVTDVADAVDLVRTADRRELALVVGYQRHFHPTYRRIKDLIDDGHLGRIHHASCFLGQNWIRKFDDAWRTDPSLSGGGQLYDSGSHLLDTLLWTTGTTPASVAAVMDYRDHEVDVNSALALRLDRGGRTVTASVSVTADGPADPGTYEGFTVWGTEGRLSYCRDALTVTEHGGSTTEYPTDEETGFEAFLGRKLTDFVETVRGEHPPTVSGSFGLEVVALTEACYEAHRTGTVVDVAEILDPSG
ncbi:Gfo/Idh/MocA family protein [Halegenticoccus tardaugens]|uniref:Gfo/Idh/MocA family protein n=1 Tax=Halegenticoccus tardaugens TaxID=2071624 RepID=UPI00100A64BC|nr:Gfo/Idh/MocA family oxidoreductase [Halegenticoccus tardaugens]